MDSELSFFEIGVPDDQRARTFYSKLFTWSFPPMGDSGQTSIETPTMRAGLHGSDAQAQIIVYFAVPDIEAAVARVRELGGEADDPTAEETGFGRFANCRDDQGVTFGLHQTPTEG